MSKEKLIEKVINAIDKALQQTDVSGLSLCEHKGTEWHGHVSQYRCVDCGKWLGNDAKPPVIRELNLVK